MITLISLPSRRFWPVACASLACLLGAAHQVSATPPATRSVTVSYRDLDLKTIEGARTLYQRLKGAARTVCEGSGVGGVQDVVGFRACFDAALSEAVAKVNTPFLTAMHGKAPTQTAMLSK